MNEIQKTANTPLAKLKGILANETMKQNFQNVLKENAGAFTASIIELFQSDNYLQKCDPGAVVMEAMRAATLKLPLNKQLGFAYIVPYAGKATFQLGYKGLIQLAQRSGQYRYINAGEVYEGETVKRDRMTGMVEISGEPTSNNVIGYFAYFQLMNGFEKCIYKTKEEVRAHAERFSKSYKSNSSPWQTDFDAMAQKTVLKNILSKYGPMSIELANAVANDARDEEAEIQQEADRNANSIPIHLPTDPGERTTPSEQIPLDSLIPPEAGF